MFSQLGPAARAIVTLAEQECRNASHYYLGTEHLLLAMAIAPPQDVARYFHSVHLEPWQVKRALRDALAVTIEHSSNGIIVTERVKRIIDIAASYIGRST
ncbi:MAG: Clp protease N-terminal domain-containing protein, partial [Candidatus Eremiobacteraeota bacterium]|nr:Clp protease N-terminal domain-containing protein [Candidatus Eremiobacteraeota bacterium]